MLCTTCSSTVRPIAAWDIDGTMGKYHEQFVDFLQDYFDRHFKSDWDGKGNWEDFLGISREQYREAKLAYRQGGFHRWMPVHQGMNTVVNAMRAADVEVWVTTTRPYLRHDSVDPDTREWLLRNSFPFEHLLYDEDKYAKLASIVDPSRVIAVVDDIPSQYLAAQHELGTQVPILVDRYHNLAWREEEKHCAFPSLVKHLPTLGSAAAEVVARAQEWREQHAC